MKRQVMRDVFMRAGELPLESFGVAGNGTGMAELSLCAQNAAMDGADLADALVAEGFCTRVDLPRVAGLPFNVGIKVSCRVDVVLGGRELTPELRKRLGIG